MSYDTHALIHKLMTLPMEGSEASIAAAGALIAEDARFWQQGAGWIRREDKLAAWRMMAPMLSSLRSDVQSIVVEGERFAVEMLITTPDDRMVATLFATVRGGRIVEAREYIQSLGASAPF